MAEKWLTYEELAVAFGIGKESARTLVKRKRWPRKMGNDGLARIGVPEDLIEARIVPQVTPPSELQNNPQVDPRNDPPVSDPAVAVLSRHIERLELQLAEAIAKATDRDQIAAQRDLANAQVEALKGVIAIERQRTDEWRAVADRFASQAENLTAASETRRSWWPWRRTG